jgi:hypothetical protein
MAMLLKLITRFRLDQELTVYCFCLLLQNQLTHLATDSSESYSILNPDDLTTPVHLTCSLESISWADAGLDRVTGSTDNCRSSPRNDSSVMTRATALAIVSMMICGVSVFKWFETDGLVS